MKVGAEVTREGCLIKFRAWENKKENMEPGRRVGEESTSVSFLKKFEEQIFFFVNFFRPFVDVNVFLSLNCLVFSVRFQVRVHQFKMHFGDGLKADKKIFLCGSEGDAEGEDFQHLFIKYINK